MSIVLNWFDPATAPKVRNGKLVIQKAPRVAQIIDGQHRVIGLATAIEKRIRRSLSSITGHLVYGPYNQRVCRYFSVNQHRAEAGATKLVFDLYSVASDYIVDPAALRAGDLATELNERPDSPFLQYVNFPGTPKGHKGLALSTIVSALKPLVEDKGVFDQVGLSELQMQSQFLINFFKVLRDAYGAEWESPTNVFRMAAGFVGALEFVKNKLVVHCNITGDFTSEAIAKVLKLSEGSLIRRESIEGLQGRRAFNYVASAIEDVFDPTEGKDRKIRV